MWLHQLRYLSSHPPLFCPLTHAQKCWLAHTLQTKWNEFCKYYLYTKMCIFLKIKLNYQKFFFSFLLTILESGREDGRGKRVTNKRGRARKGRVSFTQCWTEDLSPEFKRYYLLPANFIEDMNVWFLRRSTSNACCVGLTKEEMC